MPKEIGVAYWRYISDRVVTILGLLLMLRIVVGLSMLFILGVCGWVMCVGFRFMVGGGGSVLSFIYSGCGA